MERKKYPIGAEYYTLYEEVGQGVSASVHRALCKALNEIVAIKILDFERSNSDLNNISREAQIMNLVDHPNILKSNCSFVSDHSLWVVMPYMAGGSCLHILKASHPDGFEEVVIATILRETLKGLEYLHSHGLIHRDVKAGNILLDARGHIKLGDLGVSACLFDSGDRQRLRNTFVGTPCWMAPEVMEQLHGYDFKADIWSFGITALELAHGHAPFSRYPPMKVLLMTLQNAPPGLDYERDKKFSKSFREIIASCLVKDPSKRPSSKKLLKYSFFKQARSSDYLVRTLLEGLPALGDRIKALKIKEEDMLAQKKIPDGQMEEMSQNEYKRGISCWKFDLEDVKAQAALIQDVEDTSSDANQVGNSGSSPLDVSENNAMQNQSAHPPLIDSASNEAKIRCDKSDDECKATSSCYEQHIQKSSPPHDHYAINSGEKPNTESSKGIFDGTANQGHRKENSQEASIPPSKGESIAVPQAIDYLPSELHSKAAKTSASQSEELDEKAKAPVVQQKGRFKVTSENVELEKVTPSPVLQKSQSMQGIPSQHTPVPVPLIPSPIVPDLTAPTPSSNSIFQALQSLLQSNIVQRDNILSLMKQLANGDTTGGLTAAVEKSMLEVVHDREKDLLNEVSEFQWSLICAQEELQKQKSDSSEVKN